MRKISTPLQYILVIFICFTSSLSFGQYLFDDAKLIYNTLESKYPTVIVESDSITKIKFKNRPYRMLYPPVDSVKLDEYGNYSFEFIEFPTQISLRIDTSVYEDLKFNNLKIDANQIQLKMENATVLSLKNQASIKIISTINTYSKNSNLHQNVISSNPYFAEIITTDFGKINKSLSSEIATITLEKRNVLDNELALLYADSLLNDETLLSIKKIQIQHTTPAILPEESFQNLVNDMRPAKQGFSSTALLAGLSDFIVDRAQEEFNITFLENLKDKLDDENYQELSILFPSSKNFLDQINITDYKSFIPQARAIFINDAENLFFNFPEVLKLEKYAGKDVSLQPIVYDLMTLYSMVELMQREIPIDTILPYTYNKIVQTQKDVKKDIYKTVADNIDPESLTAFQSQVQEHVDLLIAEKDTLLDLIESDIQPYFKDTTISVEQKEILFSFWTEYNKFKKTKLFSEEQNKYFGGWLILQNIPTNLKGEMYYEKYTTKPDINQFSSLFSENPNPKQLVSAGFDLTQTITAGTLTKPSRARLLSDFYQSIATAKLQLDFLQKEKTDTLFQNRVEVFKSKKKDLIKQIRSQKSKWTESKKANHQIQALFFMEKAVSNIKTRKIKNASTLENVAIEYENISSKLIDYLIDQEEKQDEKYPLLEYLTQPEKADPTIPENKNIQTLLSQASDIETKLKNFKKQYAQSLLNAQINLNVLGNLLETNTQLLNLFKANPESGNKWIQKEQRDELLSNKKLQNIYLGLVYEQLSSLKPNNTLSPSGMASLTSHFMQEIANINFAYDNIQIKNQNDTLDTNFRDYYPILRSVVSMMGISINTPIFVQPNNNSNLIGLFEKDTSYLKLFPEITTKTLNLFDNTYEKHYNYALYNIVELLDLMTQAKYRNCSDGPCLKQKNTLKTVQKYGNFFTQVAVANNADQVNAALKAVALPPGSSRMKRQTRMSITVNGYFGFNFGNEQYTNPSLTLLNKKSPNTFGLSVPIGISINGKTQKDKWGSWSFFVPIIDIGMVTAYRLDNKNGELPETSFRNVLAPGAFLLRNFKKSPFTLGIGLQFGPQNRNVNYLNTDFDTGAIRYTIMGGIDIPFFNLFQGKDF